MHWSINEDKLLCRNLAVYVFNNSVTKKEILRIHHDDSSIDHFARTCTKATIRKKYFWFSMLSDIDEYVRTCLDYQRIRVYHHKFYDKLESISSENEHSFHTIILDFIIDISFARNFYTNKISDAILILINKLIKYATYISITKNLDVSTFEELMWREFVS